ncbi:hypothetical protein [Agrobacterium tumefaciens]|uniref:hypothetical protein n=1 Tax=Agrobacterium tumefaciens TaxID=358 RepID=UPI001574EA83|nr:hypothetical protein [Agrobacterium tumefaciens]NTA19298.1 hypothetical protein [Agrobacterium tumefaciens]WCK74789.1 hypothetical protein G6L96_025340 [Agrobacterium tumefaciens]
MPLSYSILARPLSEAWSEFVHPSDFLNEYVVPSAEHWKANQTSKHLAVHAISQIDIMADVVANHIGRQARAYRDDLGQRYPALAKIRDAHDSHKHGQLNRQTALFVSQGQRPDEAVGHAFFVGVTHLSGPLTPFTYLALTLNDGSTEKVYTLIKDGMDAWAQEIAALGI